MQLSLANFLAAPSIFDDPLTLGLLILGGLALGALGGYLVGGVRHHQHKAVQDELYTRKLKFAEEQALEAETVATKLSARSVTQEQAVRAAKEWAAELEGELSNRGTRLQEMEERGQRQSAELEELRGRFERESSHNAEFRDELETEEAKLRTDLKQRKLQVETLTQAVAELEEAKSNLEEERERLSAETERRATHGAQVTNRVAKLEAELERASALTNDLRANPPRIVERNALLQSWQEETLELPTAQEADVEEFLEKMERQDPECAALLRKERELLFVSQRLEEAESDGLSLADELEGRGEKLSSVEVALAAREEELRVVRAQLEELKISLTADVRTKEERLAEFVARVAKLEPLQLELRESQSKLSTAEKRVEELEDDIDGARSSADATETEMKRLEERIDELEPMLEAARKERLEGEESRESLELQVQELEADLTKQRSLADSIERERDRFREKRDELRTALDREREERAADEGRRVRESESLRQAQGKEKTQLESEMARELKARELQDQKEREKIANMHASELDKVRAAAEREVAKIAGELDRIQREHELEIERRSKRSEKVTAELSARLEDLEPLKAVVADSRKQATDHRKQLSSVQSLAKTAQLKVGKLTSQVDDWKAKVKAREEEMRELKKELREAKLKAKRNGRAAAKPKTAKPKAAAKAPAKKASSAETRDDLKQINGIGPKFAKELAKNGVTSFEAIAKWKSADIEAMAEKLGASVARIEREEWVKKAAELVKAKA